MTDVAIHDRLSREATLEAMPTLYSYAGDAHNWPDSAPMVRDPSPIPSIAQSQRRDLEALEAAQLIEIENRGRRLGRFLRITDRGRDALEAYLDDRIRAWLDLR